MDVEMKSSVGEEAVSETVPQTVLENVSENGSSSVSETVPETTVTGKSSEVENPTVEEMPSTSTAQEENKADDGDEGEQEIEEIKFREGVTYDELIDLCRERFEDERAVQKLTSLREKSKESLFWGYDVCKNMIDNYFYFVANEMNPVILNTHVQDFVSEFKRLDQFLNIQKKLGKKERKKRINLVNKLHQQIKRNQKKIEQLDLAEISLDDLENEDAPHIKKEKYERALARDSRKLLELQGAKDIALRYLDKNLRYDKTEYPSLNRAISNHYRLTMKNKVPGGKSRPLYSTPNYYDILEVVKKTKEADSLPIADVEDVARKITDEITKEIQHRRECEFEEMIDDYICYEETHPETYADEEDENFKKAMEENTKKGEERISNVEKELEKKSKELEASGQPEGQSESSEEDEEEEEEEEDEEEEEPVDPAELSDLDEDVKDEPSTNGGQDPGEKEKVDDEMSVIQLDCEEDEEEGEGDDSIIAQRAEKRTLQENGNENDQTKKPKFETGDTDTPLNGTCTSTPKVPRSKNEDCSFAPSESLQLSSPSNSTSKMDNVDSDVIELDSSRQDSCIKSVQSIGVISSNLDSDDDDVICLD